MHEATFRVEPGGPYGTPTIGVDAAVECWCNDHCDLLDVRGSEADAVVTAIEERVGLRDRVVHGDRVLAITGACLREREGTVERHLERHGCLLVPPLRYVDGAKSCRVLALDPADLTGLYRDLIDESTVTVESKRSIDAPTVNGPLPSIDSVLSGLSPRQRETLIVAHGRGYYAIPRETTTAEIADVLGIERRTAEEHLRRAENKLIESLSDVLVPTTPRYES